jgi:hypothetical protein
MMHAEALWRFLDSHRGKMFCTRCIAVALVTDNRIDRIVIAAEGRGRGGGSDPARWAARLGYSSA